MVFIPIRLRRLSLVCSAALWALPGHGTVLDFPSSNGFDQTYGDIDNQLELNYTYQTGTSTGPLAWWGTGYDELSGVAWASQIAAGTVARVVLQVLDSERALVLNSFRLGSWEGAGTGRVETVTVTRLGESTPAFSFSGLIGVGNQSMLFEPQLRSSSGVVIEWSNPWWTAIDDIDHTLTSNVPEPGTAALLLLGAAGLATRRLARPEVRS